MFRSAMKSDISDKMTFLQNGVDEVRRNARMSIDEVNNGGSFVELGDKKDTVDGNIRKIYILYIYTYTYTYNKLECFNLKL